jgi:hypothetical protein
VRAKWWNPSSPHVNVCQNADVAHIALGICLAAVQAVYGEDWDKPEEPRPAGWLRQFMEEMRDNDAVRIERSYTICLPDGGGRWMVGDSSVDDACRNGWIDPAGESEWVLTEKGRKALEQCND